MSKTPEEIEELARAFLEAYWETYGEAVLELASRRLGVPRDVLKDAFQEAYLRHYRALQFPYGVTIVVNRFRDERRRKVREVPLPDDLVERSGAPEASPEKLRLGEAELRLIRTRLSPAEAIVLRLWTAPVTISDELVAFLLQPRSKDPAKVVQVLRAKALDKINVSRGTASSVSAVAVPKDGPMTGKRSWSPTIERVLRRASELLKDGSPLRASLFRTWFEWRPADAETLEAIHQTLEQMVDAFRLRSEP